jgi:hypothetical protein
MAIPIDIEDAWQITPNRNNNIPFNYIYDKQLEKWVPQTKQTNLNSQSAIESASAFVRQFGSNESVDGSVSDSSPETVWLGSSLYVFPPDVGTGIQIHSTNNADTNQVVIEGLDENFLMKAWTGNLNGTGYVNTIGKWARVFGAYNNSSTSFIGTVNIHPSGNVSSNYLLINANDNQSLMAVYTIPANYTGYLVSYGMSAHNAGASSSIGYNIKIKTREFGKIFRTQASNSFGTEESIERFLSFPMKLPPKTDIKFDIVSANGNNGSVDAEFSIALLN